ncbi:MAG: PIG-L deacetylase family protein [Anaerolineales bacterium]
MPNAIYLSPHLDDAVFSCGGLIARQVIQGQSVTVLTVCAGDPPPGPLSEFAQELHQRWGDEQEPMETRRQEDLDACSSLEAAVMHLAVPEAIYRVSATGRHLYASEEEIFGDLEPADNLLIDQLAEAIDEVSPAGSQLYAPIGIGGHVDHLVVRRAASQLERPVWFYHEFPYAAEGMDLPEDLGAPQGVGSVMPLEDDEVEQWAQAIWTYESQRSTFWYDLRELRHELQLYLADHRGLPIFAPTTGRRAR